MGERPDPTDFAPQLSWPQEVNWQKIAIWPIPFRQIGGVFAS